MDRAHEWTDEEIGRLERRMAREYGQAVREMRGRLDRFLKKYSSELEQRERAMDDTPEAREALDSWKRDRAADRKWMDGMVESLSRDLRDTQSRAIGLVEDRLPRIYSENADWAAFEVDRAARLDTAFNLMDEDTARQLMGRGELLFEPPRPNAAKVAAWTDRKLTGAITQGILQGESVPHIADRVAQVYSMSRGAAVRTARTACTGAENAGRISSYERAQRLGIDLRQEWMATLDERTRDTHRLLDGERVEVGDPFVTADGDELRFPGDPQGPASEVYNCRCTLVAAIDGIDQSAAARFDRLPDGTTYEEWREQARRRMEGQQVGEPEVVRVPEHQVVEGRDILGTWRRRSEEFDFEIEDVMNAQGFDGKPRIVDADEFDRAVKQANNGNGLIMQRTYSAPDQATLDAYRDMLYNGKWYVDCSTGGAQYGQGMYAAADYSGILSQGIKDEMEHYTELGLRRYEKASIKAFNESATMEEVLADSRFAAYESKEVEAVIRYDFGFGGRPSALEEDLVEEIMDSRMVDEIHSAYVEYRAKWIESHGTKSYVETMTLDPSARVITWKDAMRAMDKNWEPGMPGDVGSYAAAMGYDAINAVGHGKSGSYTVVLNRTKLIIRRPE